MATRSLLAGAGMLLAACGPSIQGKYQDAEKKDRYYDFTRYGKWTDQDGDKGTYRIEGDRIVMTGLTTYDGRIVSPQEIHLFNVPLGGDDKYNTYRRGS